MSFIRELNHEYFADLLSADVMSLLAPIDSQRTEVQQFVTRMFRQMHRQRTDAHDFSERLALMTGALLQHLLPGAWGGIPPLRKPVGMPQLTNISPVTRGGPWAPATVCWISAAAFRR